MCALGVDFPGQQAGFPGSYSVLEHPFHALEDVARQLSVPVRPEVAPALHTLDCSRADELQQHEQKNTCLGKEEPKTLKDSEEIIQCQQSLFLHEGTKSLDTQNLFAAFASCLGLKLPCALHENANYPLCCMTTLNNQQTTCRLLTKTLTAHELRRCLLAKYHLMPVLQYMFIRPSTYMNNSSTCFSEIIRLSPASK